MHKIEHKHIIGHMGTNKIHPKTISPVKYQNGKTNYFVDSGKRAELPGKRLSKTGHIYYEYRKNRSDLSGRRV